MTRRLLLLPGIGADRRLFDGQQSCAADLEVIDWIAPASPVEPLATYAKRLATTVDSSRPFVLGGASFGGMVALEMARHLQPDAVVIIGSCRSPSALPASYRILHACSGFLPDALLGLLIRTPLIASRFGVRTPEHRRLFADMLSDTPPSFIRWASRAIFGWPGITDLPVPVHHIHGGDDQIIPVRRLTPEIIVKRAGHLLTVTHPAEVNAFLDAITSPTT